VSSVVSQRLHVSVPESSTTRTHTRARARTHTHTHTSTAAANKEHCVHTHTPVAERKFVSRTALSDLMRDFLRAASASPL
jgi:hypothetical protein